MEQMIPEFLAYLIQDRHASKSTVASYERDLKKMFLFLEEKGVEHVCDITATNLNSYILYLERKGMSISTVSRSVASMRAFFLYAQKREDLKENPVEEIKAPHVEKKAPEIWLEAARLAGVAPERCTIFDDSIAACRGARAAHMRVVGVYDAFFAHDEDQMRQFCDVYIQSFEELLWTPEQKERRR